MLFNVSRELQKDQYHFEEAKDFSALRIVKDQGEVKKG